MDRIHEGSGGRRAALLAGAAIGAAFSLASTLSFGSAAFPAILLSVLVGAAEGLLIGGTGLVLGKLAPGPLAARGPRILLVGASSAAVHLALSALVFLAWGERLFFLAGIVALLSAIVGEWMTAGDRAARAEAQALALAAAAPSPEGGPPADMAAAWGLSPREREVASLILARATYREMAGLLFVSLPTVKSHCSSIYAKAGVANRAGLIELAAGKEAGEGRTIPRTPRGERRPPPPPSRTSP